MRRAFSSLLLTLVAFTAMAGCAGREPRFDIVPGPIPIPRIWSTIDAPLALGTEGWACVDAAYAEYLRQFTELIRQQATPLVRGFKSERGDRWRNDAPLIERFISRQQSLLETMSVIDAAFIARLETCGLDEAARTRLRHDREIERARVVIEGHGPRVMDLRSLVRAPPGASAAVDALLDDYARSLAAALPPLRDAERARLARLRRTIERLEAEEAQRPAHVRRPSDQLVKVAEAEVAVQVRRALSRVLDLNLGTLEQLRALVTEEQFDLIEARVFAHLETGAGGTAADPLAVWQVEVIAAAASLSPEARAQTRERLARFRERDRALRDALLARLRLGEVVAADDPARADRDVLRKELLSATLGLLPQDEREGLIAIGQANRVDLEATLRRIAPGSADVLLARAPPGVPPTEPEPLGLPEPPGSGAALFLPAPADERWLEGVLERAGARAEAADVARQLWRDQAGAALRTIAPAHEKVGELEKELFSSLSSPGTATRAFDRYMGAIDEERQMIAAAEEALFDALDPLLEPSDPGIRSMLRLERRLERDRIDWRFMPFGDSIGFGSAAGVTAPAVLERVTLDSGERAIALEVLREHLPGLVTESAGFRSEGVATIRRLVSLLARVHAEGNDPEALRAGFPGIAQSARASVERHDHLHRAVIDGVAERLPDRAEELRGAWRRAAYPELFLAERRVEPIVSMIRSTAAGDAALAARVEARLRRSRTELDAAEEEIVSARREARFDQPPNDREAVRDRLREWPELSLTVAKWRGVHARLLRDLAMLVDEERVRAEVDQWMRAEPEGRSYWIAE